MSRGSSVSRRGFLKGAAALAAPTIITSSALGANGRPPASERLVLAGIGMGGRGQGDLSDFMNHPEAQVVAVCDVKKEHVDGVKSKVDKKYGNADCKVYGDYREVLARNDIDMVLCGTPDHWHAQVSIDACKSGKDVYCEKPLTLTIGEGRKMVRAARRYGRVCSSGSIAARGDSKAIDQIAKLVSSRNQAVSAAALAALGKLGGKDAAQLLQNAKVGSSLESARIEALLVCADGMGRAAAARIQKAIYEDPDTNPALRIAALRGLIATDEKRAVSFLARHLGADNAYMRGSALRLVVTEKNSVVTGAVLATLGVIRMDRCAAAIEALGERGDSSAFHGVMKYVGSENEAIRSAAIAACGKLGDASHVKMLIQRTGASDEAIVAISAMNDEGVDDVALELLENDETRIAAIKILLGRGCMKAAQKLVNLLSHDDVEVRKEAWAALGGLPAESEFDEMMRRALKIKDATERRHAERAINDLYTRAIDRDECFRNTKNPGAFKMLDPFLNDANLKSEAEVAANELAGDIRKRTPDEAAAISNRLIKTSKNENVLEDANSCLEWIKESQQ
jgi:HEAT repeat protein